MRLRGLEFRQVLGFPRSPEARVVSHNLVSGDVLYILYNRYMRRKQVLLGFGLIGIAGLPMIYVHSRLRGHNWDPLSTSVSLTPGAVETAEFVSDLSGTYIVSLAFSPKNIAQEECLVGDRLFKTDCQQLGSGLDLDWSVTRRDLGEEIILIDSQTYSPHAFGGAGAVQTELGRFNAQPGGRYKIGLRVRQSSEELRTSSPLLKVDAHWVYWEKWVEYEQLSFWFAALVGISGLVNLIRGFRLPSHTPS
jgi:hypothetical protein